VLWGAEGRPRGGGGITAIWKSWADQVDGHPIACGHFIPEEAPDVTTEKLLAFFGQ